MWSRSKSRHHAERCVLATATNTTTNTTPNNIRRLPPPDCDPNIACANPSHLSTVCNAADSPPPPPYTPHPPTHHKDDTTRTSFSTHGTAHDSSVWCQLAYWEMNRRVGGKYNVDQPAVNVFSASPKNRGFCLEAVAQEASSPPNVARTRAKIGLGVTLSREDDDVWLYNRSEQPVFVHSPLLDDVDTRTFLVYKVPSRHCLCVYNSIKAMKRPRPHWSHYSAVPTGPIDFNSVRISFAKGWGPKYTRQEVTACPCWLEVMLAPCR